MKDLKDPYGLYPALVVKKFSSQTTQTLQTGLGTDMDMYGPYLGRSSHPKPSRRSKQALVHQNHRDGVDMYGP